MSRVNIFRVASFTFETTLKQTVFRRFIKYRDNGYERLMTNPFVNSFCWKYHWFGIQSPELRVHSLCRLKQHLLNPKEKKKVGEETFLLGDKNRARNPKL